jgi:hypothetical protein
MSAASDAVRKVYDPQWLDKLTRFLPEARRGGAEEEAKGDETSGEEGVPAIEGT